MTGKSVSGHSRSQTRQQRPIGCGRCGKRIKDGTGRRVDGKLLCPRCQARQDPSQLSAARCRAPAATPDVTAFSPQSALTRPVPM
jgi:hypothetical protein